MGNNRAEKKIICMEKKIEIAATCASYRIGLSNFDLI